MMQTNLSVSPLRCTRKILLSTTRVIWAQRPVESGSTASFRRCDYGIGGVSAALKVAARMETALTAASLTASHAASSPARPRLLENGAAKCCLP